MPITQETVQRNLEALGLTLPVAAKPAANYQPFVITQRLVYISGQLPLGGDPAAPVYGALGKDRTIAEGQAAARMATLHILAQLLEACEGQWDRVKRCVKITVFVHSTPDFTDHPQVANGASDILVQVLGSDGEHARAAIGVSQLPRGVCVEVEAIFELI